MTHLVHWQQWLCRGERREAGPAGDDDAAGQSRLVIDRLQAVGESVLSGENGDYARQGLGDSFINRFDLGVRVRRAHQRGERHVRQRDIRQIAAASGQEAHILLARNRLTNTEFYHDRIHFASVSCGTVSMPMLRWRTRGRIALRSIDGHERWHDRPVVHNGLRSRDTGPSTSSPGPDPAMTLRGDRSPGRGPVMTLRGLVMTFRGPVMTLKGR
jgi:hypothetical protein